MKCLFDSIRTKRTLRCNYDIRLYELGAVVHLHLLYPSTCNSLALVIPCL